MCVFCVGWTNESIAKCQMPNVDCQSPIVDCRLSIVERPILARSECDANRGVWPLHRCNAQCVWCPYARQDTATAIFLQGILKCCGYARRDVGMYVGYIWYELHEGVDRSKLRNSADLLGIQITKSREGSKESKRVRKKRTCYRV